MAGRAARTATATHDHDDYSLRRVPATARYPWPIVALQRFGQLSNVTQFLLGATLGFALPFWQAVLALVVGTITLEALTILIGVIGVQQGLSTSLVSRWTGFGRKGSALIGLVIAISMVGWFGVQNGVLAEGLTQSIGLLPMWAWALIGGMAVTVICAVGFKGMAWVAGIAVPAFLALVIYTVGTELARHDLGTLLNARPAGPPMSMAAATTVVAGGFIIASVLCPDMTRFNRSVGDVIKQTVVGVTLGELVIGASGILLALALRTSDIAAIVIGSSGLLGAMLLGAATLKVNDWNLYSGSLGVVNIINVFTGRPVSRVAVTFILGGLGSIVSALGIVGHFTQFLIFQGVFLPPIVGIMIAEYFVVRTWRADLDDSCERGQLPAHAPEWVIPGLIAWAAGWAAGYFITIGIPALTSAVAAFLVYWICSRIPLPRPRRADDLEGRSQRQ